VALSASVEPGHETKEIIHRIEFRLGKHYFDRRDCKRHNVDYIFRDIKYAHTGHVFRNLDWLIPADLRKPSDIVKRLLFTDTIEHGHITTYLRSLLPENLENVARIAVRHMHSMNCPYCKLEGIAALYQTGDKRETALFIASPILEVGVWTLLISRKSSCTQNRLARRHVCSELVGLHVDQTRHTAALSCMSKNQELMRHRNMWPWTHLAHGC
jgi:hypothetical protein